MKVGLVRMVTPNVRVVMLSSLKIGVPVKPMRWAVGSSRIIFSA